MHGFIDLALETKHNIFFPEKLFYSQCLQEFIEILTENLEWRN